MRILHGPLSRRTLLRGAGVSLTLPLLDAMVPSTTLAANASTMALKPKRIGYVYVPMGYYAPEWKPTGETLDSLPSTLSPLQPVKDDLCVLSGLDLQNAYPGSHATSNSAFLSAAKAKLTESSDYYLGTTVDQIAAQHIGSSTPLPSLELAMDLIAMVGQCDNGYACVYQNNLSWSSPTTPLPSEAHPRLVFEMLFGEGGTPEQRRASLQRRSSLLDSISDELKSLQRKVGPSDRRKMDGYLESIRDVERRIQLAERDMNQGTARDLERPVGVPDSYAEHARLMFDLQWLAFQSDTTRVVSFQLAREASNRTYPEIGVPDPHHPITHHGKNPEKLAKIAKINQFHVSLFAEFLAKLKTTPEADGSLLDHSIFLYGSGMGDPDAHDHSNLPILVAGGAASGLRGNRHLEFGQPTPLSNLHLTLLNKVGVPMERFSDSTGKIDHLFDPIQL
ncbi:MAG: DUF1552 domain-containing protein [Pirellulales bacterium]